jgi:hypothetical protein
MAGNIEPDFRASCAPTAAHEKHFDVTGENAWEWIRSSEEAFLYLYKNITTKECETAFSISPEDTNIGRMDLSCNDHESLPESARSGYALKYVNGRLQKMSTCANATFFKFNVTEEVSKEEL